MEIEAVFLGESLGFARLPDFDRVAHCAQKWLFSGKARPDSLSSLVEESARDRNEESNMPFVIRTLRCTQLEQRRNLALE